MLRGEGLTVNRKRVQRLMRRMGIAALGPKPKTTKPAPGHRIYPYLLRDLVIDRPNQVWAADITYIPIGRGFLYLVAVIDWFSRAVLAWRLSNTMDVAFCVDALDGALARFGRPEIFNSDQGSQFTSAAFTGTLSAAGIRIWMDGRGRWLDNVFIERLWRSPKYEDVYLEGYADGREARAGIGLDQFLQRQTPTSGAGRPDTDGRVARGCHRSPRRERCGHDAKKLGQRYRVAHMPTATTTATEAIDLRSVIKEDRAGPASNQDHRPRGPAHGVHFSPARAVSPATSPLTLSVAPLAAPAPSRNSPTNPSRTHGVRFARLRQQAAKAGCGYGAQDAASGRHH